MYISNILLFLTFFIQNVYSNQVHSKEDDVVKEEWGEIVQIENSKNVVGYQWNVTDFHGLIEEELIFSPRFYVTKAGYRLQLMIIPNTTYSDNTSFTGIFFRIVTGDNDSTITWPFQLKTVLSIVHQNESVSFIVTPNTDPCRLRSAFLRPSSDNDNNPHPDGCGNRRHIQLDILRQAYLSNEQSLTINAMIYLNDFGSSYKQAKMGMKYNNLISNFEWIIKDFIKVQNESLTNENVVVLTSEPFYTHSSGYLMQMFMTVLPKKKAFALSIALSQGDHDRYLQWPFPYEFEVAIVDQSPGYWRRDYTMSMHPSTSQCGTSAFNHPNGFPEFCFVTIQSIELLSLTHYNFIVNDTLKIRFTTKFTRFSGRKQASIKMHNNNLVSEFTWLIPSLEAKVTTNDKPKLLSSEEFYSNGQGYLMQIVMSINTTEQDESILGLQLSIIEGEYDDVIDWPFNYNYTLTFMKQKNILQEFNSQNDTDVSISIHPSASSCPKSSFQKPIERNTPCGDENLITLDDASKQLDNLLVKATIYFT